jgi:UDP-N-acetylmuramyl pentapeptide phosphotransferase/UDP-N-acetylglucosamine-1-phosphate transferase
MDVFIFIIIIIAATVAILVFAFKVARQAQKAIDAQKQKSGEKKKQSHGWAALQILHSVFGGIFAGLLKYAYNWRNAPPGSADRLKWELLLAVVALGLWVVIKFIDRRINREERRKEMVGILSSPEEAEAYA